MLIFYGMNIPWGGKVLMDTLYIVMPAYNEEENIQAVVRAWYPLIASANAESRLVVADSGSSDQTHDILLKLKKDFTKLEILSQTGKQHGPKVIALYRYAIDHGADYIFQTDSDGQTNPAEFDAFWNMRNSYAAILGYRQIRGDGISRALVEKVVCVLLKLYFGIRVPDANAPFRLMRADTVAKYLSRLPENYNLPNIMLTTYFSYYKEKIAFETVSFKPRQGGKNSINIPKIAQIGWKALRDFRMFKNEMRKDQSKVTDK